MIDHVGEQLAGRGLGLHALQQLVAGRAQELDLDEGKALVERVDDRRSRSRPRWRCRRRACLPCAPPRSARAGRTGPAPATGEHEAERERAARQRGATGSLAIPVSPCSIPRSTSRTASRTASKFGTHTLVSLVEAFGHQRRHLQRRQIAVLLDRIDLPLLGEQPVQVEPRRVRVLRGLRNAGARRARSARPRAGRRSRPARRRAASG